MCAEYGTLLTRGLFHWYVSVVDGFEKTLTIYHGGRRISERVLPFFLETEGRPHGVEKKFRFQIKDDIKAARIEATKAYR
jgi:hypothetical protein